MAGLYYEQFEPGHVVKHAVTRTVTEMDNLLITTLSMNTQSLHPCDYLTPLLMLADGVLSMNTQPLHPCDCSALMRVQP